MQKVTVEDESGSATTKQIMVTDDVKHSIPLDEILSGGPPKDGIPSIDNPKFTSVEEAGEWLTAEQELGLAVSSNGEDRFYPYRILVQHEIVNDTFGDQRVLITYCPLCFTGIVFDPTVDGEQVEFGVSGKLWNSNLLMYDRRTDSLWSQITGEAVVGKQTGQKLTIIPSDVTTYDAWKEEHPDGKVLSRNTGHARSYDAIPYGGDLTHIAPFFPVSNSDDRLDENAYIIGIRVDNKAKAYHFDAVKDQGEVVDEFAGKTIVARYNQESDSIRIFERFDDGTQERLESVPSFWFSWVAVYPDTQVYL